MSLLTADEIRQALAHLPNWCYQENALFKEFSFRDFSSAFAFVTRVALLAEKFNHHPNWSNSYGKVHLKLTTHEAGGVTEKDIHLAQQIEQLLQH